MIIGLVLVTLLAIALGLYVGVALAIAFDIANNPWTAFTANVPWAWRWVARLARWALGRDQ